MTIIDSGGVDSKNGIEGSRITEKWPSYFYTELLFTASSCPFSDIFNNQEQFLQIAMLIRDLFITS